MAPHDSAANVFTVFLNEGGWPTQGLAFFVGLLGTVFSFLGADSAVHMSEEIRDASTVVPRTIILSIMINGVLGFGMLIAVLFCAGDLQAALASPTGYPFMEIFRAGVGSTAGSTIMVSIVVTMALCSTIGLVATSSRMYWSFARDRGLPCWRYLSRVSNQLSSALTEIQSNAVTIAFQNNLQLYLHLRTFPLTVSFTRSILAHPFQPSQ